MYGIGTQFGLYGIANQAASSAGVYGSGAVGVQGGGTVYGLQGGSSASGGFGVYGTAPQYGVYGSATAGGNAAGVYGTGPNFGVCGLSTGGNNTVGVYGQGGYGMQAGGTQFGIWSQVQNGSPAIAGTYGIYGAPSASGQNPSVKICYFGCGGDPEYDATILFQAGVWADTNYFGDYNNIYRPALMATADHDIAGVLVNNSDVVPVLFVYNAGEGGGSTGTVIIAQGSKGTCSFTGNGDTSCTGTLKSTVKATTADGPARVETYAVESAENWFEDAGSAQLVNGMVHVNLEPIFGQTVNTDIEYHVFLTPNDDCKGLYVTNKTASGFRCTNWAEADLQSHSSTASWPSGWAMKRNVWCMSSRRVPIGGSILPRQLSKPPNKGPAESEAYPSTKGSLPRAAATRPSAWWTTRNASARCGVSSHGFGRPLD